MIALRSIPRTLILAACAALVLACGDGATAPEPPASCAAPGGTDHAAFAPGERVWRRADGPHRLLGDITVTSSLDIEPGTLICGASGARIIVDAADPSRTGELIARGTVAAPIVFTALDPQAPWGGIVVNSSGQQMAELSHVRLEYALRGIRGGGWVMDSSVIRQIRQYAVSTNLYGGTLSHSVVDTAALDGGVAVFMDGGALEESVVRGSGGVGVDVRRYSTRIRGVRIEGSQGIGLTVGIPHYPHVEGGGIRIVGGASYPARMPLGTLLQLWPTRADQDSLLGNAGDTLLITSGYTGEGEAVVYADLPWILSPDYNSGGIMRLSGSFTLRLEPGASVESIGRVELDSARLEATGTTDAPVTLRGGTWVFQGAPVDTSRLADARLSGVRIVANDSHPLVLEGVASTDSGSIALRSAGSRLFGSVVEGGAPIVVEPVGHDTTHASVVLGAPGVSLERTIVRGALGHGVSIQAPGVRLSGCEVSGSHGDGVLVTTATDVQIHGCNLRDNEGPGVRNTAASSIAAEGNWWGDPAGPEGTAGDGVAGDVDYLPVLSAPVQVDVTAPSAKLR